MRDRLTRILEGRGELADLDYLNELAETVKTASRCGLGQTSPNPVLSTLSNFREAYERLIRPVDGALRPSFDLASAVADAERITGRRSASVNGASK
jgi:[NiFe] hydrogenase diaphorase moiety large subunit